MNDLARLLAATCLVAVAGCRTHASTTDSAAIESPAPATAASAAATATRAPFVMPAATPMASAQYDVLREKFRALAESYVALVRSGQPGEAWRYLPADLHEKIPEAAHAAWWKSAVPAADLGRIYVGAVAVDPEGGTVSLVTPSRSHLLRIVGQEKPGVVPQDLLATRSAFPAAAPVEAWMPLVPGAGASYMVQRETVTVTSLSDALGHPEWKERLTGVLREDVVGPDKALGGIAATLVKSDRPVNKPDDASIPETRRMWLETSKRGIAIVAEQESDGEKPYAEKPQTIVLPAELKLGARWDGGKAALEDVPLAMSFEVAAIADAPTEAGISRDCIEVRGWGTGTKKNGAVTSRGEISIHRWYAKGEGLVREIRQESLRKTGASGASFERTKMTVRSRLPNAQEHRLAFAINSNEIAKPAPRQDASGPGPEVLEMAPPTGGRNSDPAAEMAALNAAREQARAQMQARGSEFGKSGKTGTIDMKATYERVENADGSVSYQPKIDVQEHADPTPPVYLGSGGE